MEITIKINNKIYDMIVNEQITHEEMENEGYFFVEETNKIVIMNPSSYYLWKFIYDNAKENDYRVIDEEILRNYFLKYFYFKNNELDNLINDIDLAIYHFINEKFLYRK